MMIGIYKFIVRCIGALPGKKYIATMLSVVASLLPMREGTIARLQLRWILGEKAPPLWKVYRSILLQVFELCMLTKLLPKVSAPPREFVEGLLEKKRPIVGLTAHLGNWDLIAAYYHSKGIPLYAVGREARNPAIHELLIWLRERAGIKVLWRSSRSAMEGAREIKRALKTGGIVASLIDQDINAVTSEPSTFFGHSCRTPVAMIDMGLQHNAVFVSAFCIRNEDGTFTLTMRELPDTDITSIVAAFHSDLETLLRTYPEQWAWVHKRWRTPEDKTLSSKEYISWLQQKISSPH